MEENQNSFEQIEKNIEEQDKSSKKSELKFAIIFILIILIVVSFGLGYQKYINNEKEKLAQENYQKYLNFEKTYEEAMKADTYGGKTPEETLQMFIDALKNEDIELASKYFALNTNEKSEYYLTRKEWEEALMRAKEQNKIKDIINILNKLKIDPSHNFNKEVWFVSKNNQGLVEYSVILKLNEYTKVWKIESL
jgi:hypothetical protein